MSVKQGQLSQEVVVSAQKTRYEVGFWFIVLLLTGSVWPAYVRFFPWDDPSASLSTFLWGAEVGVVYRPFAYRVLLPLMTAVAERVFPLVPMLYNDIFIFFFMLGFVVALRRLAHHFWEPSRLLDYVVLLSIPLIIPFSLEHQHFYDVPILCLSTWCIVFLAQKRWRAFLICYSIACFNKETTLFLSLMFAACYAHEYKSRWYWRVLGMQLGIYTLIRASLMYILRDIPGGVVEYHLLDHILYYLSDLPKTFAYFVSVEIVVALMLYDIRSKPVFLRKALFSVLPIMVVLFIFLGFPYELRIFYEIYAPLLLFCLPPRYFRARSAYSSTSGLAERADRQRGGGQVQAG